MIKNGEKVPMSAQMLEAVAVANGHRPLQMTQSVSRTRKERPSRYAEMATEIGALVFMIVALWMLYILAWACM